MLFLFYLMINIKNFLSFILIIINIQKMNTKVNQAAEEG
jgi:hypothetical protein